jgi:anti-sigma B factor antagonist
VSSFSIDSFRYGGQCHLAVRGEVDFSVADDLAQFAIRRLEDADIQHLVIDLDAVTFIDCAGLGALVAVHNASGAADKRVAVCNLSRPVERLLALTGQHLRFADNADELTSSSSLLS